jgi:malonate transporter and related proteins
MIDILNLAVPYFGPIFIGFACGKAKALPESGLARMNFFLLCVSLPALLFMITSKTPFPELNNPPFLIARNHDRVHPDGAARVPVKTN